MSNLTIIAEFYKLMKDRCTILHIYLFSYCSPFIHKDFWRYFMKDSVLILTEQRQSNDKSPISTIIQQAITAWLAKELSK